MKGMMEHACLVHEWIKFTNSATANQQLPPMRAVEEQPINDCGAGSERQKNPKLTLETRPATPTMPTSHLVANLQI